MEKRYCPYCMSPQKDDGPCPVCGLTAGNYIPSPHHLPLGTVLQDRYLIGRVLGEGGFGITYIGCDLRLELKVAIKEYFPVDRATRNASSSLWVSSFLGATSKSYERGKQKFLAEARLMARMEKQQVVVGARDFFEENNTAYIVMEYIEGTTFSELVKQRGGRIPPAELFEAVEPLFHALTQVHEMGLIHRDISPDNLMLEHGHVRLLDFGCAREASTGNETMTITLKHGYAPLEQYQQKGQGPWTDVYALCATLYFCLVGQAPPQAMDRIIEDPLLLPSKLGVDLSPRREQALLKGLRIAPNRRYQSMKELWAAIYTEPQEPEAVEAPPASVGTSEPTPLMAPSAVSEPPASTPASAPAVVLNAPEEGTAPPAEASKPTIMEHTTELLRRYVPKKLPRSVFVLMAVLMVIAVIVGFLPKGGKDAPIQGGEESVAEESVDVQDGRAVISGNRDGVLERLMADETVTSITVASGVSLWSDEITITKPVLVEQGAELSGLYLTVEKTGSLQVEGRVYTDLLLRLKGNQSAFSLSGDGVLDMSWFGFIWGDSELTVRRLRGGWDGHAHFVVADEEAMQEQGVHVSNQDEFLQAAEQNADIVVDGDVELELPDFLDCQNVLVPEGCSLTVRGECGPVFTEGAVLINRGSVNGKWNCHDGSSVLNFGTASAGGQSEDKDACDGFWMDNETYLLNAGTLSVDGLSRIWNSGVVLNLPEGEMNALSFGLMNSSILYNRGRLNVSDTETNNDKGLFVRNGSELLNDGELVVNGTLENHHLMTNFQNGSIQLQEGSVFRSNQLYNEGTLTGTDVNLDPGVIWGPANATVNGSENLVWWYDEGPFDDAETVENEDQLRYALKNDDVPAVCVPAGADVAITDSLTISKPLLVEGGVGFAPNAACKVDGGFLSVREGAALNVYQLALKQSIFLLEGSLTVNAPEKERMELWESALLSRYGTLTFSEEDGGFTQCRLRKSTLVCPYITGGNATRIEVGYDSCFFPSNSVLDGEESSVYVSKKGVLTLCAEGNTLRNLTVDGLLNVDCGSFVQNGSSEWNGEVYGNQCSMEISGSLTNNGYAGLGAWDEFSFHQYDGTLENNGTMELWYNNLQLSDQVTNKGRIVDNTGTAHDGSWP